VEEWSASCSALHRALAAATNAAAAAAAATEANPVAGTHISSGASSGTAAPGAVAGSGRRGASGGGSAGRSGLNSASGAEAAMEWVEACTDLDYRFSSVRCKQARVVAQEHYREGLPLHYPTPVHQEHVSRALAAFHRVARGPACAVGSAAVEAECARVWRGGRRLCDATSLTGHPCTHRLHALPSASGE
ncbi:hypothetical protein CYMTET_36401, partial [Cymbomonas tetramitiformis]